MLKRIRFYTFLITNYKVSDDDINQLLALNILNQFHLNLISCYNYVFISPREIRLNYKFSVSYYFLIVTFWSINKLYIWRIIYNTFFQQPNRNLKFVNYQYFRHVGVINILIFNCILDGNFFFIIKGLIAFWDCMKVFVFLYEIDLGVTVVNHINLT